MRKEVESQKLKTLSRVTHPVGVRAGRPQWLLAALPDPGFLLLRSFLFPVSVITQSTSSFSWTWYWGPRCVISVYLSSPVSYGVSFQQVGFSLYPVGAPLVTQAVENLPAMREAQVRALVQEEPLEKGVATHSSILAWRIPWSEEPGGLQFMGLQRGGHDWATNAFTFTSYTGFPQAVPLLEKLPLAEKPLPPMLFVMMFVTLCSLGFPCPVQGHHLAPRFVGLKERGAPSPSVLSENLHFSVDTSFRKSLPSLPEGTFTSFGPSML